jgi:hypothetical protein
MQTPEEPSPSTVQTSEEHIFPVLGSSQVEVSLRAVITAIFEAVKDISVQLRTAETTATGGTNTFGDQQLKVDMICDAICFGKLRGCGAVTCASSEENTDMVNMGGIGYSVSFDPLDGSSVIDANFAVVRKIWRFLMRRFVTTQLYVLIRTCSLLGEYFWCVAREHINRSLWTGASCGLICGIRAKGRGSVGPWRQG